MLSQAQRKAIAIKFAMKKKGINPKKSEDLSIANPSLAPEKPFKSPKLQTFGRIKSFLK